jgi:hypothetical protein
MIEHSSDKLFDVVAWSAATEPSAVLYVASLLSTVGSLSLTRASLWGALQFDCSPETIKRWLLKHSCGHPSCEFILSGSILTLAEVKHARSRAARSKNNGGFNTSG